MEYLDHHPVHARRAAALLAAGELVALPTETVYGLAADARNPDAVAKVFQAKGRPADHPLIVHIPHLAHLAHWAATVPPAALRLAEAFWPGPLTLVLPASAQASPLITGGQDTIAVRWSAHPLFQAVLDELGHAVVAPSANPFGHISPTCAGHVLKNMQGRIAAVLDGGPCRVGVESTIVDLSGPAARVLRPGAISEAQLAEILPLASRASAPAPRVPGALASHYAPRLPCFRVENQARPLRWPPHPERRWAYIGFGPAPENTLQTHLLPDDPAACASRIYAVLHEADAGACTHLLIELPPDHPDWLPVRDRLLRASVPLPEDLATR